MTKDVTWMLKNIFRLCAVCLLSLLLSMAGTASAWAEEVYTVTETELQLLETNLTKLEAINREQQKELKLQKSMLSQAKFDLEELNQALTESKQELNQAQSSLENANQLLKEYAKEEKSKRLLIKRQRNLYYCLAIGLGAGLIYKTTH